VNQHHLLVVSQHADIYARLLQEAQLPGLTYRVCEPSRPGDCDKVDILFGAPDSIVPLLSQCPQLRWVQSSWAGVKPLLEHPRRDYRLTGVKGIFGAAMTEYVLAWLLGLERDIPGRTRARKWNDKPDGTLRGKQIGIMGTGSIGAHLAGVCGDLGMIVRGLNMDGHPVRNFDQCFSNAERTGFADSLDYLVALLPDTPGSDGLVNHELLARVRPGAILINGGRANVIDEKALLQALDSGQLAHAVLDVLPEEPLPSSSPLWQVDRLYITSHTAAVTVPQDIVGVFCDNYRRYYRGEALRYEIDFEKGY
jgi:phosphoglycerate dehydrogenase-like enzyme